MNAAVGASRERQRETPRRTVAARFTLVASLVGAFGSASIACDDRSEGLPVARVVAAEGEEVDGETVARVRARAEFLRHELRRRLDRGFALPSKPARRSCPADVFDRGNGAAVVWLVEDARIQPKHLLPLRLTDAVVAGSETEARTLARAPTLDDGSPSEVERWVSTLEDTLDRRFAAVVHVIHFSEPRWIRKAGRRRPQWVPGWAMGWVAVHGFEDGSVLCLDDFSLRSDVSEAPLAVRLRADTREALVKALGEKVREHAESMLADLR